MVEDELKLIINSEIFPRGKGRFTQTVRTSLVSQPVHPFRDGKGTLSGQCDVSDQWSESWSVPVGVRSELTVLIEVVEVPLLLLGKSTEWSSVG